MGPLVCILIPADSTIEPHEIELPDDYLKCIERKLRIAQGETVKTSYIAKKNREEGICVYSPYRGAPNNRATNLLRIQNRSQVNKYPIVGDAILADISDAHKNVTIAQYEILSTPINHLANFPEEYIPQNFAKKPRSWMMDYLQQHTNLKDEKSFNDFKLYNDTRNWHQAKLIIAGQEFASEFNQKLADAKDEALFKALLYIKHHEAEVHAYYAMERNAIDWNPDMVESDEEEKEAEEKSDDEWATIRFEARNNAIDAVNTTDGWVQIVEGLGKKIYAEGTTNIETNCRLYLHFTMYKEGMEIIDTSRQRNGSLAVFDAIGGEGHSIVVKGNLSSLACIQLIVPHMKKGEKAYVMSSHEHAFKELGDAEFDIPPNAKIFWDLELVDIQNHNAPVTKKEKTPEERVASAKKQKEDAKPFLDLNNLPKALQQYISGILILSPKQFEECSEELAAEAQELRAVLNLNAAIVHLKIAKEESAREAQKCCNEVLKVQPNNVKALYTRFRAFKAMNDFDFAEQDILQAIKLSPEDKSFSAGLREIQKLKKQQDKKDSARFSFIINNLASEGEKEEMKRNSTTTAENSNGMDDSTKLERENSNEAQSASASGSENSTETKESKQKEELGGKESFFSDAKFEMSFDRDATLTPDALTAKFTEMRIQEKEKEKEKKANEGKSE